MKIAIASGKGGTGKTTVAVSLALSLENTQIIDCDVEEPNVHLFLKPKISQKIPVKTLIPEIDYEKCDFCRRCSEICVYNALTVLKFNENEGEVLIFPQLCHGCGGCILLCPKGAIKEGEREIGIISIGEKDGIKFIEGRLNISEVLAPKIIEKAKSYIEPDKIVILDAPPGTTCPVVETLKDVDFCLLVTEPTPFGLHDLELAYKVTQALNIPSGVIINKSEKDELIEDFCKKNNIPIFLKIPFKTEIAEAYSKGIPLVKALPEYKKVFQEIYQKIKDVL